MNQQSPRPSPALGIVGAGQLARMTYQAAISLGLTVRLLAERANDSAAVVGADVMLGSPRSATDLAAFADGCSVVTFDHELVAVEHVAALEREGRRFRPASAVLALAQNKRRQRETLRDLGFPVPPFRVVRTAGEIVTFAEQVGWPLVLKAAQGGYDGRGVWVVESPAEGTAVLDQATQRGLAIIAEQRVPIERELATLVARRPGGETVVYPVVETVQADGMCREILAPAPIACDRASAAQRLALEVAEAIGATGILAVELFDAGGEILINELAARPHNSGHYSIEGCLTSQFENHVRAALDLPLGAPALTAPAVVTVNVVGDTGGSDPRDHLTSALTVAEAHVHLYGKTARPERKLGHVTVTGERLEIARDRARQAASLLTSNLAGAPS